MQLLCYQCSIRRSAPSISETDAHIHTHMPSASHKDVVHMCTYILTHTTNTIPQYPSTSHTHCSQGDDKHEYIIYLSSLLLKISIVLFRGAHLNLKNRQLLT